MLRYRNYRKFDKICLEISSEGIAIKNFQIKHLDLFEATAHYVVDRHESLKEKHVRCNQAAFVNKRLRNAVMARSRL